MSILDIAKIYGAFGEMHYQVLVIGIIGSILGRFAGISMIAKEARAAKEDSSAIDHFQGTRGRRHVHHTKPR